MSGHEKEGQSRFIQHHFDGPQHQFDSGKLGIWAFLVQEILFFSALFVAYIVYRANHPELYFYANHYLDTTMGGINTAVLIVSSLTAAWAVRCAQLGQRKGLLVTLGVTVLCAFGFLTIKYFEYSHKIHDGILFGAKFKPVKDPHGRYFTLDKYVRSAVITSTVHKGSPEEVNLVRAKYCMRIAGEKKPEGPAIVSKDIPMEPMTCADMAGFMANYMPEQRKTLQDNLAKAQKTGEGVSQAKANLSKFNSTYQPVEKWTGKYFVPPRGLSPAQYTGYQGNPESVPAPPNTNMFFSIYFAMTGLHGIHVLAGIFVFIWLFFRANRGDFTPDYFGPIDYAALYWHLVDLIWIFLFPMLYLIH